MKRKKDILAEKISGLLEGADPKEIVDAAFSNFETSAIFAGFSGGFDSLVTTHWMMNNVPGCKVFHANTGIGIEATRLFVRETCAKNNWPLTEIRAKEDCGQDYDEMVIEHGFPGPGQHGTMFIRLKERCVRKLLKDNKQKRLDNVMLATGIRKDESQRRSGYAYKIISFAGNTLWISPFYFKNRSWFSAYIKEHSLKQNPVSKILGMSGECLCGAYAHKGELDLIKIVCPETYERIRKLEEKVKAAGHLRGWEELPIKNKKDSSKEKFMPFCVGCEK